MVNAQQINITLYNTDNGLPQSQVNCMMRDSYGFMWIGTQDGLSYYDGYAFKIFSTNPLDPLSICDNYIYSIAEDANTDIWIGTRNGLSRYNRSSGCFTNFYININHSNFNCDGAVYSVLIDRQGNLWILTANALHLFNREKGDFEQFQHNNNPQNLTSEFDNSPIYEDSQGQLWVGTKAGLFQFSKDTRTFTHIANKEALSGASNRIISIFEDSKEQLWVGTENGLFRYNTDNKSCQLYRNSRQGNAILGSIVEFIGEDHDGVLWVGTDVALNILHQNGSIQHITDIVYNGHMGKIADVVSVIRDKSKILWIGTQVGLVKWSEYNQRFKSLARNNDGNTFFGGNIIASIFYEPNGLIWLGTWGTGLFCYNPKNGEVVGYSSKNPARRIVNDHAQVIYKQKDGTMLIGTRNGVMYYNKGNGQFYPFRPSVVDGLFNNNRVYAIDEDAEGNLWFATRLGLHMVMSNGSVKSFFANSTDSVRLLSDEVRDVEVDKRGNIWVATMGGVNCLHPSLTSIKNYTKAEHYTGSEILSNDIYCIHEDKHGDLWFGTSSGVHKFDVQKEQFSIFSDSKNLVNGLVYSVEEDKAGRMWMGTNRGLVMLDPKTGIVRGFSINDGLLSNEFNLGASHTASNGNMFFGTLLGLNYFNPDSVALNSVQPEMLITSVEVMSSDGKLHVYPPNIANIKLIQGFRYLNIYFTALDFNSPERNEYRYKIEGYDSTWNNLGTKHSVTFTSLEEGHYLFKVMGSNNDGVWSKQPRELNINVVAPLWRSKIALILYAIVVVVALFLTMIYRDRNLNRINKLLKEREFVLSELEDQKEVLVTSNKNMTDSIHYAKRIQEAIMPSDNVFKAILPDSFILYMPKDIVSGDFYWINETHNKIFVAAVDCTGHGVPGAFMSIIGIELLRNITNIEGVNDAAEILNRLSVSIYGTFSSGINEESLKVKDGMDVAFCVIDREYNTLQYAGAFNNLFLLREDKIIEIGGDRYSVGANTEDGNMFFSSYYIPLQQDDMFYILSDGYVDQFGGIEGKKFKLRRFRNLLLNIHKLPAEAQRKYLYDTITAWKGMNEQIDDIMVIGVRPDLSCLF